MKYGYHTLDDLGKDGVEYQKYVTLNNIANELAEQNRILKLQATSITLQTCAIYGFKIKEFDQQTLTDFLLALTNDEAIPDKKTEPKK